MMRRRASVVSHQLRVRGHVPGSRGESVIVAHDELRFDLVHCVHRHADHNQQRCATEEERNAQAVEQPARKMRVDEIPYKRQAAAAGYPRSSPSE